MNVTEMATAFFLGDAIRRFWTFYDKHSDFQKNDKVMVIHLVMFTIYMISVLCRSILIFYMISSDNSNLKQVTDLGVVYTIDIWLQFFDELIIFYLILSFIQPQNRVLTDNGSITFSL